MIENQLIHFKTYANFKNALEAGIISDNESIVFIKDTKQIYTHGTFYDASNVIEEDEEIIAFALNLLNYKIDNLDLLPKNVIFEDNDIYIEKADGNIYPVNHPDLSTQASILPLRFGTLKIYEVLVRNVPNVKFYDDLGSIFITSIKEDSYPTPEDEGEMLVFSNMLRLWCNNLKTVLPFLKFMLDDSKSRYLISIVSSKPKETLVILGKQKGYNGDTIVIDSTLINSGKYYLGVKYKMEYDVYTQKIKLTLAEEIPEKSQIITEELPLNALILEASAFNSDQCVPASTRKEGGKIIIENDMGIIPDFALVRYTLNGRGYYGGYGE